MSENKTKETTERGMRRTRKGNDEQNEAQRSSTQRTTAFYSVLSQILLFFLA